MKKIRQQSLQQNLIFNVIYQVVVVLSPLVVTPKFSRVMGAEYVGIRSFTYSIVFYFGIIGTLGLSMYGQRRIAIVKDNKEERSRIFLSIALIKMICCLISFCTYLCVFVIFNSNLMMRSIYLCWTLYLVQEMISPVWYLQATERFKLISVVNIFSHIAYVVCVLLFVNKKEDLGLYILFYTAIPLIVVLIFIPLVLKDIQRVHLDKKELLFIAKDSIVYFVPTLAGALYSMIDKTMLGLFDESKVTTGYYEQAEKLVKVALTFSTASFSIIRTRMSYVLNNKSKEVYKSYCDKFISLSMFLCWPILFGIIGLAKDFVPLFFGGEYGAVTGLVYVFVWVIPCLTISGLLQAIYIFPQGLQNRMNIYYIIVLCVNCCLNSCLIPFFQAYGSVIASIFSELLLAIVLLYKARKIIDIKVFFVKSIRYMIAALSMLFVIHFVAKAEMVLLYKLCLEFISGCGSYLIICIILRDFFVIEQIKKCLRFLSKRLRGRENYE